MSRPHIQQTGFTLIELLVVIAIIAILAAILFPVFARVKAKAEQISCLSNTKQLTLAFLMYAEDYGGTLPFAYDYADDWSSESAWDYHIDYVNGTSSLGLIGPYTRTEQLNACPLATGLESWGRPYSGYAYNTSFLGGSPDEGKEPARVGDIGNPTETVLLCDGGYWNIPFGGGVESVATSNYLRAPDPGDGSVDYMYNWIGPNVHFRHNGMVNVAYCDGHARAVGRRFNTSPYDDSLADLSADASAYDLE